MTTSAEQKLRETLMDAKTIFTNAFRAEWMDDLASMIAEFGEEVGWDDWQRALMERALNDAGKWSGGMSSTNISEAWAAEATRDLARRANRRFERKALIKEAKIRMAKLKANA